MDAVWMAVVVTTANTAFWFALYIGMSFLIRALPQKLFDPGLMLFRSRPFENRLYAKLRVSKWKDKLPENGKLVGFSKRTLQSCTDPVYIGQFIRETCIGEIVHFFIGALGYLSLLFIFLFEEPADLILVIFAVIATINILFQIPLIMVQRYNRPRLIKLRDRLEKAAPAAAI